MSNSAYPTNRTAWKYSIEPRGIGPVSIASALEDVRASYTLPIDRRVAEQSFETSLVVVVNGGAVSLDRSLLAFLFGGGAA